MDSRLSPLDLADPPEQWDSIEQRTPRQSLPPGPSTPHRIATVALALVIASAGTLFAIRALSVGRHSAIPPAMPSTADMRTYTDPSGWSTEYPAAWRVFPIKRSTIDVVSTGVKITNALSRRTPDGAWLTVTFASESLTRPPSDDSSFPLSMEDALEAPGDSDIRILEFRGNGVSYVASLRAGPAVSAEVLSEMDTVVSSIRFPSLEIGQQANGWLSLGARRYSNGVGTPTSIGRIGVAYVMRGPASTYALALPPFPRSYMERCAQGLDDTWDAIRLQIWIRCPSGDVRFERNGDPVPGNPAGLTSKLTAYPVITAWDGSRLVSTSPMTRAQEEHAWSG
jgi:hypothetical protein